MPSCIFTRTTQPATVRQRAVLMAIRNSSRSTRATRQQLAAAENAALDAMAAGSSAAWALSIGKRSLPRPTGLPSRWRNRP